MKKYRIEIIILILQVFLHCIFPVFAGPGDEMGLVLLLLLGTFCLGFLMGLFSKKKIKFAYPIVPALLLIVTIPIYYNSSALIHALWYFLMSAMGVLLGFLISVFCRTALKTKLMIVAAVIFLAAIVKIGFCVQENPLDKYSNETGMNLSWGDVIEDEDSHGGFHGDGTKTNGYYFFIDRHSENKDIYDSSEILNRHSFNFTILLYDCDTDLLYIIEEDT